MLPRTEKHVHLTHCKFLHFILSNFINTFAVFVKIIPVWMIQQYDFLNTLRKGKAQVGLSIVKKYFCLLIHCKREKQPVVEAIK